MTNHFTELYKTYSTKQLVDLISRKDDYQPEAVIAAQNELDSRGLTESDFSFTETQQPEQNAGSQLLQKLLSLHDKYLSFSNEPKWLSYLINAVSLLLIIHFGLTYFQTMRELSLILFDLPSSKESVYILYFIGFIVARMVFVILFLLRFKIA